MEIGLYFYFYIVGACLGVVFGFVLSVLRDWVRW